MAGQLMSISVRSQVKAMTRDLTKVQRKIVPKITARALNFTGRKIRTQAVRRVSAAAQVKQKIIRSRLRFARQANPGDLRLVISAWFMNIFALDLGRVKGLKVDVPTFSKKFVATMPSGHEGIYARQSTNRLPIKEVSVPLNPQGENIMVSLMGKFAIDTFLKEWRRLLAVRLRRKG